MTDPYAPSPTPQPYNPTVVVASGTIPGRGLAIAGLILDFFVPLVGLILSIVARSAAKRAGAPTTVATMGVVLGIVFMAIYVIIFVAIGASIAAVANECAQLGAGVHHVGSTTYTCGY